MMEGRQEMMGGEPTKIRWPAKKLDEQTRLYPANACFGATLSLFVAVFTKSTTIYCCRLCTYQQKVMFSSPENYINPGRAI